MIYSACSVLEHVVRMPHVVNRHGGTSLQLATAKNANHYVADGRGARLKRRQPICCLRAISRMFDSPFPRQLVFGRPLGLPISTTYDCYCRMSQSFNRILIAVLRCLLADLPGQTSADTGTGTRRPGYSSHLLSGARSWSCLAIWCENARDIEGLQQFVVPVSRERHWNEDVRLRCRAPSLINLRHTARFRPR